LLVRRLSGLVEAHTDLRFSQILSNFGFVTSDSRDLASNEAWRDEFHVEPDAILERVDQILRELE